MLTCKVCRDVETDKITCPECTIRIQNRPQHEGPLSNEHVDVRSIYPTYVKGIFATSLEGKDRSITVEDAAYVVNQLGL